MLYTVRSTGDVISDNGNTNRPSIVEDVIAIPKGPVVVCLTIAESAIGMFAMWQKRGEMWIRKVTTIVGGFCRETRTNGGKPSLLPYRGTHSWLHTFIQDASL